MPKKVKKLDELFHDGLKDIYFAEKKILVALPKMAKAADSEELANAFREHEKQTKEQVNRLEKVFQLIDETPRAKNCPAITGIIDEGEEARRVKPHPVCSPRLKAPRRPPLRQRSRAIGRVETVAPSHRYLCVHGERG
jgi:hypothetical protein